MSKMMIWEIFLNNIHHKNGENFSTKIRLSILKMSSRNKIYVKIVIYSKSKINKILKKAAKMYIVVFISMLSSSSFFQC